MIEIIGTFRDNLENAVICKVEKNEANEILQNLRQTCMEEYVRFYARPELMKLYDVEVQIIEYALKKLIENKVAFNNLDFAEKVETILIDSFEQIPWVDSDTLGQTISKIYELSPSEIQHIIGVENEG